MVPRADRLRYRTVTRFPTRLHTVESVHFHSEFFIPMVSKCRRLISVWFFVQEGKLESNSGINLAKHFTLNAGA